MVSTTQVHLPYHHLTWQKMDRQILGVALVVLEPKVVPVVLEPKAVPAVLVAPSNQRSQSIRLII